MWAAVTAAERSGPMSEVRGRSREDPMPEGRRARGVTPRLRSRAAAERSYPTSKVRSGGCEEIPHIQDKRNLSKKVGVARGHQRADTLKPYSQKTS